MLLFILLSLLSWNNLLIIVVGSDNAATGILVVFVFAWVYTRHFIFGWILYSLWYLKNGGGRKKSRRRGEGEEKRRKEEKSRARESLKKNIIFTLLIKVWITWLPQYSWLGWRERILLRWMVIVRTIYYYYLY